jgi:hypothetical protein
LKKFITSLLLVLVLITFCSKAQERKVIHKKADKYSYSVITDNPAKQGLLTLMLDPFIADLNDLNLNLGAGATVNYNFRNIFGISGKYRIAYTESAPKNDYTLPVGGIPPFSQLDVCGMIHLVSRIDSGTESITVTTEEKEHHTVSVPAKQLITYSLRAGYISLETYAAGGNLVYSGYDISDPNKIPRDIGGNFGSVMREKVIYLGYANSNISHLVVDFDIFGRKRKGSVIGWYADVMYAPVLTYSDVVVVGEDQGGNTIHTTYHVDDNTSKFRFGARAGFTYGTLSVTGSSIGLEAGMRPAPDPISGLYFLVDVGLSLNARVF